MHYAKVKTDCDACSKVTHCILHENLSSHEMERIVSNCIRTIYEPGEQMFLEGEETQHLMIVCKGEVDLQKTGADGSTLRMRRVRPGTVMGARSLLSDRHYAHSAQAVDRVEVAKIPAKIFYKAIGDNKDLLMALAQVLADEVRTLGGMAWSMAYRTAEQRVAEALVLMAHKGNGNEIYTRRQDIAERAGLALETTVRTLKKLERQGLVSLARGHIKLTNLDDLADVAEIV